MGGGGARERGRGVRGNGDMGKGEGGGVDDGRNICEWKYGKEAGTHKGMNGETK